MEKLGIEFWLTIAYLIPGIVSLYATTFYSTATKTLLFGQDGTPSSAGVVLIILLAIGAGIMVNAVTWAVVRPVIELTSMSRPELNYANLTASNMQAFQVINNEIYRYYQSYSNLFTSTTILTASYVLNSTSLNITLILASLIILAVLFLASRDSLKRVYTSMELLVGVTKEGNMTNGVPAPQPTVATTIEKEEKKANVNDNKEFLNDDTSKKSAERKQQKPNKANTPGRKKR